MVLTNVHFDQSIVEMSCLLKTEAYPVGKSFL